MFKGCWKIFILTILVCGAFGQMHCSLGEGFNSEGSCSPCAIDHCGYCSDSQTLTCQACIQPYQLDVDSNVCRCPQGQGPLSNGGCTYCQVLHCAYCSSAKGNICQACKPNFSSVKTQSGVQCICEYPFKLNQNGDCTCPTGQGYDSNQGCSACSVSNCQICTDSSSNTCQKCFLSSFLTNSNSTCSCPIGQGPTNGVGCAPCRPTNCASCQNSFLNRCETCNENFTKIVTDIKTTCVCSSPFVLRADGRCVCPPNQGSDGQGGCTTCSIPNCASCKISNYGICEVCLPTYTMVGGGASCECLSGQGKLIGGGCAKCQVEHCLSCDNGVKNYCYECQTNFISTVTGNSSQCLCQPPFYVNDAGVCGCIPAKYQSGNAECTDCDDEHCLECSTDGSQCFTCQDTYLLQANGSSCGCPSGQAPLNGHKCAPCADSNCASCSNSAVDICNVCAGNLTLQVTAYDNETDSAQSTICSCSAPFITTQSGQCICPPGKALNGKGVCQLCAVDGCSSCEQPAVKCSACFPPFVVNSQGNACVCPAGTALSNTTCIQCQVSNCLQCSDSFSDTCNVCQTNFALTSDSYSKNITIDNKTDDLGMQTATCVCEDPFTLNINGECVCPVGMIQSNGTCFSCQISFCDTCSSQNVCIQCNQPEMVLSNNACVCPQGEGLTTQGRCAQCSLTNCISCANSYELQCQQCLSNFTLVVTQANGINNHECQCADPYTLTSEGLCILECPLGKVGNGQGQCVPCEVNRCSKCSSAAVFSCQECLSPYIVAADGKQCSCPIGQGPVNLKCVSCDDSRCSSCPMGPSACYSCQAPYLLNQNGQCVCPPGSGYNSQGVCTQCSVSNCAQCQLSGSPTCVRCNSPASLSADSSKCTCPVGQSFMPGGGCAPCSVLNCQQCDGAVTSYCKVCKPSFLLSQTGQQCHCSEGQGPNTLGSCETCHVDFCSACHLSTYTCSVCEHPFVSNSEGTACICPVGQAPNGQGGCSRCLVNHCSSCPTSTEVLCDSCYPLYQLDNNGSFCYWPNQNFNTCPPGQGINSTTGQCDFCSIPYCLKCYSQSSTCSICQAPFVSNAEGTECICPRGQATNAQGGCAYCQVGDCQVCTSSAATTCESCDYPFKLEDGNTQCKIVLPKKHHLFGFLFSMASIFIAQTPQQSFNNGLIFGLLIFPLILIGMAFLIYYCCTFIKRKYNGNTSAISQPEPQGVNQGQYSNLVSSN